MKISMGVFIKHDPESGQTTIYGHSENTDAENRADFDQFGFWDSGNDDQYAIVSIEVELPKPKPIQVVKVKSVTAV